MRIAATVLGAVVGSILAGCGSSQPQESTADCTNQVRIDGRVYTSYSMTDREGTPFGVADQADCHDVGVGAEGSVFPDSPRQVAVWSFEEYPTEKVVGVRFDRHSFGVFVADTVPQAESNRILLELGRAAD